MARLMGGLVVALLVVPTLAITTARLQPGETLWWVILRALAPVAIVPYALAVIVLIAMSWGFRTVARPVALPVLAVVTSLLLLHVWWFVKPFLADAPGSATANGFTVMTANLHIGRADPQALLDAVDRQGVDVLVLEEITPAALADLDRRGLDRRLGHRAGTAQLNRDGIMVFSDEPLHDTTEIATSTPGVGVKMTTSGGPVRILAVHPIAPNNGVAQWSRDLDLILATAKASHEPTVVVGDFNATLDHPQLQAMMRADYRDASTDAGLLWRPTWPSPSQRVRIVGMKLPSLFGLDHVFMRGPLTTTDAHVRAVPGTDHRALVTRIAWTDAPSTP
ncbi:endonuclease/exonuclease/phosphatase family protein [Aeromicrobium ginsengisoli]|uniref:Endonuclease/exonuclease/phosphatase family protein n=1 Tax=Aeromicrobium ginsengisoli TaxID=363867 RepID=A0A5M4FES9_9ACTN|nr:endonuclease/exonuclease/phosphatase family protein [Aeromicrobium ginsengisoli]KAA1397719.1 endonuclease/exonuclease/phosphatase family protein [Aeromicrobium ginsengisoli]